MKTEQTQRSFQEQREIHRELGCAGCKYADIEALETSEPCCTFAGSLHVDETTGKCHTRQSA